MTAIWQLLPRGMILSAKAIYSGYFATPFTGELPPVDADWTVH